MHTVRVSLPVLVLLVLPLSTTRLLAQTEQPSHTVFSERFADRPRDWEITAGESGPPGSIAMLRDALPGMDQESARTLASALRRAGFGVTFLSAKQAVDPLVLRPERFFLYILPNAEVYPAAGIRALSVFLRHGGHVVFLGGPALTRPVWSYQNH
jgi:hypothetical protein